MKAGPIEFRHHTKLTDYPAAAKLSVTGSASATQVCPLTHPIVAVNPAAAAITTYSLADGEEGQMLTIVTVTSDNQVNVTPATSTTFTTIDLTTAGDIAVLLYVDDTTGWIILSLQSVASGGSPAYVV